MREYNKMMTKKCSYMIYLFDRGFRIESALNILVNQVKCPRMYIECLCLGCKDLGCIDQGTCFANNKDKTDDNFNVNDNVNVNDTVNVNNNVNINDNVNHNVNVNANGNQGTCFAYDNNNDNKNNIESDNDDDADI